MSGVDLAGYIVAGVVGIIVYIIGWYIIGMLFGVLYRGFLRTAPKLRPRVKTIKVRSLEDLDRRYPANR